MKTIVVDDEPVQLDEFRYVSEDIPEIELVGCFDSPLEALEFARQNPIELAFLDIRMPEMDGFALAKQLKKQNPRIKLIALTASDQRDNPAMKGMDGMVLKPYGQRDFEKALSDLIKETHEWRGGR